MNQPTHKESTAFPTLALACVLLLWLLLNAAQAESVKLKLDENDYVTSGFFTQPNCDNLLSGVNANAGAGVKWNWSRVSKSGSAIMDIEGRTVLTLETSASQTYLLSLDGSSSFAGSLLRARQNGTDVFTVSTAGAVVGGSFTGSGAGLTGVSLTTGVSGTLPVANGGTGITALGAGVQTFWGTPSSANLAAAVTNETGSGALVFGTSPTLTTPAIGAATATSVAASGNIAAATFSGSGSALTVGARTLSTLLTEPHISARDYGAVGDGVANDTTALQAAVAAAKAGAKALFIPAGTYLLTAPLTLDWKGARVFGAGASYYDGGTTLLANTDVTAISIATDTEGVTISNLRVKGPGTATSTKAGIHFVIGAGTNTDNALLQGIHVRDFDYGIRADDVANSVFIGCDLTHNDIGFASSGNSNSNTLIGVSAMQCATSSLKLAGGSPWSIIGGDVGGSGNAKPVDIAALAATLQGVNFESHPASSGTLVDLAANCKLVVSGCYFNWLGGGGTRPFAVTQAAGSSLSVIGGDWAVSDSTTNSSVKHATTIGISTQCVGTNVYVQQYLSGVPQTRFLASALLAQTGNDGVGADANTMGTFRVRHTQPTELQYYYKTLAGGFSIANLLQYALDTTAGVVGKTNVANTWTEHQTTAFGKAVILNRATGTTGGVLRWNEDTSNSTSRAWHLAGEAWDWNSWALMRASARGADPSVIMWYADGANNRTHIGHTGTTAPTGSATLNVQGLGTLLLNPQAAAPSGAKGMLYANTAGTLHFHDGTAWRVVMLVP